MTDAKKSKRVIPTHDHNGMLLKTVTCRVTAGELDSLRIIAKAHGQRHTVYLRKLIKAEINRFISKGVDKGRMSVLRQRRNAQEILERFE